MIKKVQRIKLKKVLGNWYAPKVLEYLNKNEFFNKKGEPYSPGYISQVFNGSEDLIIENAIFAVYAQILEERKNTDAERKNLLNKKPKADTLGSD